MPTISASGQMGPCLFVFKGKWIPFRNVLNQVVIITESTLTLLPRGSVAALREECGGVDSTNFRNWAQQFINSVSDLTQHGRKLLLIYDAYRSHLSLDVLQMFRQNNIIVYALPAHTGGKTQPLDVVIFGVFKRQLNELINICAKKEGGERWDVFMLSRLMRQAYDLSFTVGNIKSAFSRAGPWPLDSTKLLSIPRSAGPNDLITTLDADHLAHLFEEKRAEMREAVLGEEAVLHSSGL